MASRDKAHWTKASPPGNTAHLELSRAVEAPEMPRLKPSTAVMNLRVPGSLLLALKREANRRDVPYQSLVKMILDEKLRELARRPS